MLTFQPPFSLRYFTREKDNAFESKAFRSFFLSWEDALWHLCSSLKVKRGVTILVPEFFCGNVMLHMREHGLRVVEYPVNRYLVTSTTQLVRAIKKYRPEILVIFHAVGINNALMENAKEWLTLLPHDHILIEDCVHKIVAVEKIKLLHDRHFAIDSLRKVVPVQGSFVYSRERVEPIDVYQSLVTWPYRMNVTLWWLIMQMWLDFAYMTKVDRVRKIYNLRAERSMLHGYLLIGDNQLTSPGGFFMKYLAEHIKVNAIEERKREQYKRYLPVVRGLTKTKLFWLPKLKKYNAGGLRSFPLIIHNKVASRFLRYLRDKGILLRFELSDSNWSKKQKIVYLPMGLHVSDDDIQKVAGVLREFTGL